MASYDFTITATPNFDRAFWFVFRQDGDAPRVRHDSEQSARAEAERLARNNPGAEFHVCECVGSVKKTDVAWINRPKTLPF